MIETIEKLIASWITFFKAHEKLLLALVVAFVLVHYGDKAYDAYGQYLKSQQTANDQKIAILQKQNDDSAKALATLIADVDARFKADEEKIAKAKTTIVVQQAKNNAMAPSDLYTHWTDDLALPPTSITPQTDGTAIVSLDAAHATVNEIDKVAPLTEQLIATQDELKGCTTVRTAQDVQITGLNQEITAEKQGRADDAKAAKVAQRKAWRRGFKWGYVAGAATVAAVVGFFHI
jgi:hypothetical protein